MVLREYLLAGRFSEIHNPDVLKEVEQFVNICLPTPFRTFRALSRLQRTQQGQSNRSYTLLEILWPRESPHQGDREANALAERSKEMAQSFGVKLIWLPTSVARGLDLQGMLPEIKGDFVWVLPAGTTLPMDSHDPLERAIRHLTGSNQRGIYADSIASYVVRTSCLRELAGGTRPLPSDPAVLGRALRLSGYELTGDNDPEFALCELETEYGGWSRRLSRSERDSSAASRPWWRNLFSRS